MLIWLFKGSCQRKKGQKEKETILDETAAVRRLRDRYWARDLAGSFALLLVLLLLPAPTGDESRNFSALLQLIDFYFFFAKYLQIADLFGSYKRLPPSPRAKIHNHGLYTRNQRHQEINHTSLPQGAC